MPKTVNRKAESLRKIFPLGILVLLLLETAVWFQAFFREKFDACIGKNGRYRLKIEGFEMASHGSSAAKQYILKPLDDIRSELSDLSLEVFGTERVLSYEYFRTKSFEEVRISEYEYEMTTGRPDLLEKLERGLNDVISALAVPEELASSLPQREVKERNSIAAKITFKRALYLVRLDRFCDAAMTTAFAAYYIQESDPSLKEDPFVVIQPALTMALGLLEETLTSYMDPDNYTASDCKSSCGYCQDPLSTVAKYCTEVLEDLSAPNYCIRDIWTTAASMLGAYAKVHGGTFDPLRFPDDFPQQAKVALKLILAHEKSDSKSFLSRVDYYAESLRLCRMGYLPGQYEDDPHPWDPDEGFL